MSKHSMRRGRAGRRRSRCKASTLLGVRSASRASRWRSHSPSWRLALASAIFISPALSPRSGTRTVTALPRNSRRKASTTSWSSNPCESSTSTGKKAASV